MAGEWIKVEKATPSKPEIRKMARELGIDRDAIFGKWVRLWGWFDSNSVDGVVDGVVDADVDEIVGHVGFASSAVAVGWLLVDADMEQVSVPNFTTHNGESAKKRALKAKRQQRWRESSTSASTCASTKPSTGASTRGEEIRGDKNRKEKEGEGARANAIPIPASLDTPEFRASWANFLTYYVEVSKDGRPMPFTKQMANLTELTRRLDSGGSERVIADLELSIQKSPVGNLLDSKDQMGRTNGKKPKGLAIDQL